MKNNLQLFCLLISQNGLATRSVFAFSSPIASFFSGCSVR